jgi:hypothetical protein
VLHRKGDRPNRADRCQPQPREGASRPLCVLDTRRAWRLSNSRTRARLGSAARLTRPAGDEPPRLYLVRRCPAGIRLRRLCGARVQRRPGLDSSERSRPGNRLGRRDPGAVEEAELVLVLLSREALLSDWVDVGLDDPDGTRFEGARWTAGTVTASHVSSGATSACQSDPGVDRRPGWSSGGGR